MRLSDLDPRWLTVCHTPDNQRSRLGLSFVCPHCKDIRIAVWFSNPSDGLGNVKWTTGSEPKHQWDLSGSDLEDITLHPSIDCSSDGHWHGFIINGEVK